MGFAREVANEVYFTDGGLLRSMVRRRSFSRPRAIQATRQFLDQIS
jgi:ABC-type polar amino acid transport system ATPase subunit